MKLHIDSADRPTVEKFLTMGLFTGVTTNPAILQKAVWAAPTSPTWWVGQSTPAPSKCSSSPGGAAPRRSPTVVGAFEPWTPAWL